MRQSSPQTHNQPERYYTLLIRDSPTHPWEIHFGSYLRSDIRDEKDHLNDSPSHHIKFTNMKVIETGDTQVEIDQAVLQLNSQ